MMSIRFRTRRQLGHLVSRRRRVSGWLFGPRPVRRRDRRPVLNGGAFASGYQVVFQALVVILAGLVLYAFLNARRQRLGEATEIGQLRQVIVHRPGLELSRLTPDNIESLLFDGVLWASKAKEEHDAFADALRDKGVLVLYYARLLAETLDVPAGRAFVLDRVRTPELLGPCLVDPVLRLFDDQTPRPWPSSS
jgi:hypothetical protein